MGKVVPLRLKSDTDTDLFVASVQKFADAINQANAFTLKRVIDHPEAAQAISSLRESSRRLNKLVPPKFPEFPK